MADNNGRSGGQIAMNMARLGKAIANIAKAAASGGLQGAAVAAAKEFAPELIKIAIGALILLIVLPMIVISALPNIFFGYDSSATPDISSMTNKAAIISGTYFNLEQFEDTEIDSVVTRLASDYTERGKEIEQIVVNNNFTEDDLLWFIAITSVANNQDLNNMTVGGVQQMDAARLQYDARLRGKVLTVTISKIEPKIWMTQLGFNDEARIWATSLHETLSESDALERYADLYEEYRLDYSGDSGYTGGFTHGDSYDNDIDISEFVNPYLKNNVDLAIYARQAWENNWGYVWGTFGSVLTQSLFEYKLEQYPDGVGNYEEFIRTHWLGRRTTDCVGLIKGYGWLDPYTCTIKYGTNGMPDYSADYMHNAAVEGGFDHGPISTMPEIPGLGLWHDGHAGVYIGGGYAVEAIGTQFGVVRTEIAGRGWKEWYMIPFINYDVDSVEVVDD